MEVLIVTAMYPKPENPPTVLLFERRSNPYGALAWKWNCFFCKGARENGVTAKGFFNCTNVSPKARLISSTLTMD